MAELIILDDLDEVDTPERRAMLARLYEWFTTERPTPILAPERDLGYDPVSSASEEDFDTRI